MMMPRTTRAEARYCVWFAASVKFLIPFSLLAGLGSFVPRHGAAPEVKMAEFVVIDRVERPSGN